MNHLPIKRRRSPDDEFFDEGYIVCRLHCNKYIRTKSAEEDSFDYEESCIDINCQILGCQLAFRSIQSYEEHYASRHKNVCLECKKTLPTNHLLEIHLNEQHSPIFQILCSKSAMYQCLVVGCKDKFLTSELRKKHLVDCHQYPSSFRFERTYNKTKLKERKKYKKDVKKRTPMEVDEGKSPMSPVENSKNKSLKFSYKVPDHITFGQGAQRAFYRRKKNHLTTSKNKKSQSTEVDIENVDMKELQAALDCS